MSIIHGCGTWLKERAHRRSCLRCGRTPVSGHVGLWHEAAGSGRPKPPRESQSGSHGSWPTSRRLAIRQSGNVEAAETQPSLVIPGARPGKARFTVQEGRAAVRVGPQLLADLDVQDYTSFGSDAAGLKPEPAKARPTRKAVAVVRAHGSGPRQRSDLDPNHRRIRAAEGLVRAPGSLAPKRLRQDRRPAWPRGEGALTAAWCARGCPVSGRQTGRQGDI